MRNISSYNSAKRFSSRIILLAVLVIMIIPGVANAAVGDVKSTVEINGSTINGPVLSDRDKFGFSIANIGDLNGDGVADLAVGATGDDDSGYYDQGAVHIMFMNTDGSIDSTIEINDSTVNGPVLSNYDEFGVSVANISDLDGDGVADLAVGASYDNASGIKRGAIHIIFLEGIPNVNPPLCNIQMSQPIYIADETVTASVFSLSNPGTSPVAVEWKVWLETPFENPISILNTGSNGTFVLPAGFDQNFGPLPLFPAAGMPTGSYMLNSRLLNPVTGELLCEDLNVFEIQ